MYTLFLLFLIRTFGSVLVLYRELESLLILLFVPRCTMYVMGSKVVLDDRLSVGVIGGIVYISYCSKPVRFNETKIKQTPY